MFTKVLLIKPNRTSHKSSRGVGIKKGLEILGDIKETFNCPVTTDVHDISQIDIAKDVFRYNSDPCFFM